MWKFTDHTLRVPGSETVDPLTGEVTQVSPVDETVSGMIVPAGYQDMNKGFQAGDYKGYFALRSLPTINKDQIITGSDTYEIKGVEYWAQKALYVLRLSKWAQA
jgi:hypothetical protein